MSGSYWSCVRVEIVVINDIDEGMQFHNEWTFVRVCLLTAVSFFIVKLYKNEFNCTNYRIRLNCDIFYFVIFFASARFCMNMFTSIILIISVNSALNRVLLWFNSFFFKLTVLYWSFDTVDLISERVLCNLRLLM